MLTIKLSSSAGQRLLRSRKPRKFFVSAIDVCQWYFFANLHSSTKVLTQKRLTLIGVTSMNTHTKSLRWLLRSINPSLQTSKPFNKSIAIYGTCFSFRMNWFFSRCKNLLIYFCFVGIWMAFNVSSVTMAISSHFFSNYNFILLLEHIRTRPCF